MIQHSELISVLDYLEAQEFELIGWGDTDVHFSIDELDDIIRQVLPGHDTEDVEDELRDRVMIVPVLDESDVEVGVRTRMAEAMHLYRNLRQWFIGQDLHRTSTLVSDYRFIRERRNYPKRDIELGPLVGRWEKLFFLHGPTKQALKTMVGDFRLSGFQARATSEILSAWENHRDKNVNSTATIVCAGTGSGKTMAFYLPALSSLATDILKNAEPRVRILAIYPRKELLKDQFNETWGEARKLDKQLLDAGARKIRIGALFGDTPASANYALKNGQEFIHFRLLKCKTPGCRGQMRWSKNDIIAKQERLVCHLCGHEVLDDEVALTRESARATPPDILFTTTEMLNQKMSDTRLRHLFGIGGPYNVPLVLLDEVHTYGGSQGAQTALLLRRWMRLSRNRPHFVGLSATLRDASNFFATLTGVNRSRVSLVEPKAEEMTEEGAEYLLALRGDPVSQTALLSTTIQTAMLTRRILDNSRSRKSVGIWGSKTFVFTDDLDINNRLYSALADAEGWWQRGGRLVPNKDGPLARLRNASSGDISSRVLKDFGQDWSVSKASGFSLDMDDRARVARTSSQDSGYDHEAEIVVTTASLEVGFNDPEVGAIIQHKAPRGVASYLQRKGRAGRQRTMRPWMVIVLSEFGRDRVAYQEYENLIDPQVKVQGLPIDNVHILKMQAAQAVIDWFSEKFSSGHIWNWLNNPDNNQQGIKALLECVDSVMVSGPAHDNLSDYIRSALQLSDHTLNQVLWQAPRSIFLEFLPTLRRQLVSNWGVWSDTEGCVVEWAELATGKWHSPAPEFIPDSSFANLDTPELQIRLERRGEVEWQGMPFFQGLKEFAPGRISKRFAVSTGAISDWLVPEDYQPNLADSVIQFEIEDAFGSINSLVASISVCGSNDLVNIYQPTRVKASSQFADKVIADTSNAFLRWRSLFLPPDSGVENTVPASSDWSETLVGVTFHTHSAMSPLELVRYNVGSDATIKFRDGRSASIQFDWMHQGRDAAVGVRQFLDGAKFEFTISDSDLDQWTNSDELIRALRPQLFQDLVLEDPIFSGNQFTANWIYECFLAAVTLESSLSDCDTRSAIATVCDGGSVIPLQEIPKFLFQLDIQSNSTTDEDSDENHGGKEQKLQKELSTLLEESEVRELLRQKSTCLYEPWGNIEDARDWMRTVLGNSLAAALQQALCTLLPNVDERSVNADIVLDSERRESLTIWLSEVESGGMGIVAQLQELYVEDPIKVLNVLHRCLQPGDYEQLDSDLHETLTEIARFGDLAHAMEKVRLSSGYNDRLSSNRRLRAMLSERGLVVSHSFSAVLYSRVLRAGSTAATDARLLGYLNRWRETEAQCGYELPMNIVAIALAIEEVSIDDAAIAFDRACRIQSTLWVRGSHVRHSALSFYNQFQVGSRRTERLLGAAICRDRCKVVNYDEESWLRDIHQVLDVNGQVDLILTRNQIHSIPKIMAMLHVYPLDTHGLLFFPRVGSVVRRGNAVRLRIESAETLF